RGLRRCRPQDRRLRQRAGRGRGGPAQSSHHHHRRRAGGTLRRPAAPVLPRTPYQGIPRMTSPHGPAHGQHGHLCSDACAHVPAAGGTYRVSPSSAVRDPAAVELACRRLAREGFKTAVDRAALAVHQRFAGTEKQRLAGLARAARQKHPIVMVTRGGYGLSRLLPAIDWRGRKSVGQGKTGMSDFTAFNLALLAQTGAPSYSGATAVADFGGDEVDDLTAALFGELMRGE